MRKLSPNFDHEYALDTVLEVPIPEESFSTTKSDNHRKWQKMKSWMKPSTKTPPFEGKNTEIQLLLGAIGAPLIPFPVKADSDHAIIKNVKDVSIEVSMAKYILKQYMAAVGGETALNSIDSMCAMGKVKMSVSEFSSGEENKVMKVKKTRNGGGEIGGFVLWQKRPELWCLEMVVSGCKISAGSDGKVSWRQHHSHASSGPPKHLRRFFQGLDPRSIANLFSNSICIGEKTINNEDCFILKLESAPSKLKTGGNLDIIRHSVCGYFSQKTGLLVHLDDTNLIKIKSADSVYWETIMESSIQDYRNVDGIIIAHSGKTQVNLIKYGENSSGDYSRTRMEEVWEIEEVDFNIKGLSDDCFLPPGDLKKEGEEGCGVPVSKVRLPFKTRGVSSRISGSNKIVAVDVYDYDELDEEDEEEL